MELIDYLKQMYHINLDSASITGVGVNDNVKYIQLWRAVAA